MINDNDKINISGTYVRNLPYEQGAKIVDGKEVEGGYFVCDSLPSWGTTGQLCYCTGTDADPINKFYQYNGTSWVEVNYTNFGAASAEHDHNGLITTLQGLLDVIEIEVINE